jgi:hypothetical protein
MELLTWDGRAKGLIDDPNMYGSFLIPAAVFCAYFLSQGVGSKLLLIGAMGIVMIGILLSFSRIAQVAVIFCVITYVLFHFRRSPRRLVMIIGGLPLIGIVLFGMASLISPEFSVRFLERLTIAQPYDLGEEGRYGRYLLVLPMIAQNAIGVGVLQLEKIFPEPIHNIWLSSFVNYGWGGGGNPQTRYGRNQDGGQQNTDYPYIGRGRGESYGRGYGDFYQRSNEGQGRDSDYQRNLGSQRQGAGHHDESYLNWRNDQIRKLDDDYDAYRREHQTKFNSDFDNWRNSRGENGNGAEAKGGSDEDRSPRMAQDRAERSSRSKSRTKSAGTEGKSATK